MTMVRPLVIFLRAGDWDGRHLATNLAITAAALGDEVHLALFGEALRVFLASRFGEGAPAGAAALGVPPLDATLMEARRDLGVRLVSCDTALRLVGREPATAVPPLDAVVSLPSLWRLAQGGRSISI
jgi:predicted peroxiredoxin